jgi:hypothetical protein
MLPTFVIIGAQKSASSFMQACLADHPDIYMPHGETPFFESPDYEHSHIGQLEKMFQGRGERCIGIKRPNYIGKPEVPARIRKHLPNAKLIAVLRNPVDRAVSAYFHSINYGFLPPLDVEVGMRRLISDPSFSSEHKRSLEIIEFGYYYRYLSKYDHYIKNGQMLILLHEDITSKPLESVQRVYDFLSVPGDFVPDSLDSRPQKVLYNLTRLKLLSCRNRFMYRYSNDRTRLYAKEMTFVDKVLTWVITTLDRKVLSMYLPNNKPTIGIELRNLLYNLYASDIEALADLINRDISAWKPRKGRM